MARTKRGRLLFKLLVGLAVLLLGGAAYAYFSFAWVFFVSPGPGGEALGLPITVVAGDGTPGFADATGAAARLRKPIRLAPWGEDAVVFADIDNHAIRIARADGRVETIAGGPERQGHRDGAAADARFDSPHGVAVRADGAIAVCEAAGCTVRLLTRRTVDGEPGPWLVSTLAGAPGETGMVDGPGAEARFDAPHAVAWGPQGELYVADIGNGRIRVIRDGRVSTVAGADGGLTWPMDIALDADGALWIADAGLAELRRWRPGHGLDAPIGARRLAMPHGVAITPQGHVAIAEMYGHRILRVDPDSARIATYVGTTESGIDAGRLAKPAAVLAHFGRLWIADLGNHRIVSVPLED